MNEAMMLVPWKASLRTMQTLWPFGCLSQNFAQAFTASGTCGCAAGAAAGAAGAAGAAAAGAAGAAGAAVGPAASTALEDARRAIAPAATTWRWRRMLDPSYWAGGAVESHMPTGGSIGCTTACRPADGPKPADRIRSRRKWGRRISTPQGVAW